MSVRLRISIVTAAVLAAAWSTEAPMASVAGLPSTVAAAGRESQAEATWSRTFKTGPNGALELWNLAGDVIVTGGSGDVMEVRAVKRLHREGRGSLDDIEIQATETAGRVRIRTEFPRRQNVSAEVEFRITVPAATALSVQTVSGDIQVGKVTGNTELESVSGDITVTGARRLARAKSVSGTISVTDSAGDAFEAHSVSGDVELRGLKATSCSLQTVSGDVLAGNAACERAEMKAVSGDIVYSGSLAPGGRYDFKSHSGDVRLNVGEGTGFSLTASTFSGDLSSELKLANFLTSGGSKHGPRNKHLAGTYGDGSAQVTVTTFSGSIVLAGSKARER
ncbi:MAG TPA: DUF4097 family beta strand repeat-containing protein [Vicinamibacterales bacterium]|nr:DUF4097 family beta strand repeat-containing protein [Vicinamibacterales bacterium]